MNTREPFTPAPSTALRRRDHAALRASLRAETEAVRDRIWERAVYWERELVAECTGVRRG